jgi:hypothetical protein
MVLRQELHLFDATLVFEREPADEVVDLYHGCRYFVINESDR